MHTTDIVLLCKRTLSRLEKMGYETDKQSSSEKLIYPNKQESQKKDKNEPENIKRVSEQELRFLFVEEFRKAFPESYYSVETPTERKYSFKGSCKSLEVDTGQSASHDMTIFRHKQNSSYKRILNIEFKHSNGPIKNTCKDIFKLIHEPYDGAFIQLLDNTDSGTLCNKSKTGVLDKLYESFRIYGNGLNKKILIVILSLKESVLLFRKIRKSDLPILKDIFFINSGCGNIKSIEGKGWQSVP